MFGPLASKAMAFKLGFKEKERKDQVALEDRTNSPPTYVGGRPPAPDPSEYFAQDASGAFDLFGRQAYRHALDNWERMVPYDAPDPAYTPGTGGGGGRDTGGGGGGGRTGRTTPGIGDSLQDQLSLPNINDFLDEDSYGGGLPSFLRASLTDEWAAKRAEMTSEWIAKQQQQDTANRAANINAQGIQSIEAMKNKLPYDGQWMLDTLGSYADTLDKSHMAARSSMADMGVDFTGGQGASLLAGLEANRTNSLLGSMRDARLAATEGNWNANLQLTQLEQAARANTANALTGFQSTPFSSIIDPMDLRTMLNPDWMAGSGKNMAGLGSLAGMGAGALLSAIPGVNIATIPAMMAGGGLGGGLASLFR